MFLRQAYSRKLANDSTVETLNSALGVFEFWLNFWQDTVSRFSGSAKSHRTSQDLSSRMAKFFYASDLPFA